MLTCSPVARRNGPHPSREVALVVPKRNAGEHAGRERRKEAPAGDASRAAPQVGDRAARERNASGTHRARELPPECARRNPVAAVLKRSSVAACRILPPGVLSTPRDGTSAICSAGEP
jgi:hypothetical protein